MGERDEALRELVAAYDNHQREYAEMPKTPHIGSVTYWVDSTGLTGGGDGRFDKVNAAVLRLRAAWAAARAALAHSAEAAAEPVAEWQASANNGKTWRRIDPEDTGMTLEERVKYLRDYRRSDGSRAYLVRALYAAPQPPAAPAEPCPTYQTQSGDHTVCKRCGETWATGQTKACEKALAVLKRAGVAPAAPGKRDALVLRRLTDTERADCIKRSKGQLSGEVHANVLVQNVTDALAAKNGMEVA